MARPGIMIYFDIRKPLSWLPNEDKGRLLDAILEYGEFGVVPEFDGMLGMAWGFIQPRLDKDGDNYENSKAQRQYASFCKKRNGYSLPKIAFEDWLEMDEEERKWRSSSDNGRYRPGVFVNGPITADNGSITADGFRYPSTPTPTSTPTSTSPSTSSSTSTYSYTSTSTAAATGTDHPDGADAPDAAAARENKLEFIRGELGKGVVKLTPFQFDLLLDRLGVDMFDHYVRKLADFIIKNGATPGNHFKLIQKWADEDAGIGG